MPQQNKPKKPVKQGSGSGAGVSDGKRTFKK